MKPAKPCHREQSLILQKKIIDLTSKAHTPLGQLKSIFNWHEKWISASDFNGCMFIKASEEFSELNNPIKQAAQAHKNWFTGHLVKILKDLSVGDTQKIAKYIVVILEGVIVNANMHNTNNLSEIRFSWRCVKQLIEENKKL